jgi:hypothetical protein
MIMELKIRGQGPRGLTTIIRIIRKDTNLKDKCFLAQNLCRKPWRDEQFLCAYFESAYQNKIEDETGRACSMHGGVEE